MKINYKLLGMLAPLSLVLGLAGGAGAQTSAAFDITHISRWGSWSVDRGAAPNVNSAMVCSESEFAFNFTGTQAAMYWGADAGAGGFTNPAFSVSVDGGPFNTFAVSGVSGSSPSQSVTLVQGQTLTDGPHTLIVKVVQPYYDASYGWNLSTTAAITVTGANPACSPYPHAPSPGGKTAVFDGDSRTEGFDSTNGPAPGDPYTYGNVGAANKGNSYPADFHRNFLDSTWTAVNQGCYSDVASHMLARQAGDVLTQFNPSNTRNVLFFWGGINDIDGGVSASTLEQTVRTYVANAKAAGVREIILGTLPYTYQVSPQGGAVQQQTDAYNAYLRANWQAVGATGLADIDADPAFTSHATTADWNADGLHFSDSGYNKIATDFHAAFVNQVTAPPLSLSLTISSAGAAFTVTPNFGTSPYTYTLTRPGMTAITNATGTLSDASTVAGVLNTYTVSVTDSEATPVTKTLTQAVVPLGAYTAASSTVTYLAPAITHNASSQPVLTWPADSTATGYLVCRSADGRATYQVIATVPSGTLTYTDTARPAAGTVYYHVVPTH